MSAPIPATSPTLSPTLSAITAGLRGSSSGIPASTFPTRSAPTSAALVKIPPPTRAKSAIEEAPIAKPAMISAKRGNSPVPGIASAASTRYRTPMPTSPSAATDRPITAPPKNAIRSALPRPSWLAAAEVRTFARVAAFIPKKPASTLLAAPAT